MQFGCDDKLCVGSGWRASCFLTAQSHNRQLDEGHNVSDEREAAAAAAASLRRIGSLTPMSSSQRERRLLKEVWAYEMFVCRSRRTILFVVPSPAE